MENERKWVELSLFLRVFRIAHSNAALENRLNLAAYVKNERLNGKKGVEKVEEIKEMMTIRH